MERLFRVLAALAVVLVVVATEPREVHATDVSAPDFDRDGGFGADPTVLHEATPTSYEWWYLSSAPIQSLDTFGDPEAGDTPIAGDFDGDNFADPAVFRLGEPAHFLILGTQGFRDITFGRTGDVPLTADFDGDRRIDVAVWRGGTPSIFYVRLATGAYQTFPFGNSALGDTPFLLDFDGDSRADIGVRRPASGDAIWHIRLASGAYPAPIRFGRTDDIYAQGDYDADGRGDLVVVRELANDNYRWFALFAAGGYASEDFGRVGDHVTQADYDGDGFTDLGVWRPGTPGRFFVHFVPDGQVVSGPMPGSTPADTPLLTFYNCMQNIAVCD